MTFLWLIVWALAGAPQVRGAWLVTLILLAWVEVMASRKVSK